MTTFSCPECGQPASLDQPEKGYVETLREAAAFLDRQAATADTPEERRAIGFLQGLVQIRQARLPIFVKQ